jgi:hypothetical protein
MLDEDLKKLQFLYENVILNDEKVSQIDRVNYWINHPYYKNIFFVTLNELLPFAEVDRSDSKNTFTNIEKLTEDLKKNGMKEPIILGVNKLTKRALVTDGNHRLVAAKKANMNLVPVQIERVFTPDKEWGLKTKIYVKGENFDNKNAKDFGFSGYTPEQLLNFLLKKQKST